MTILGNRHHLAFEVTPLAASWERRYAPEAEGWAALSLWVDGVNLCEHVRPGEDRVQPTVAVPLAPLADWFVRAWPAIAAEERAPEFPTGTRPFHDIDGWAARPPRDREDEWLEARERWWSRHFLLSGAEGAFLPNVAFVHVENVVFTAWRAARFATDDAPRFLAAPDERRIPWSVADTAVRDFVRYVARAVGEHAPYRWAASVDPFAPGSPEERIHRVALAAARSSASELLAFLGVASAPDALARLGLSSGADQSSASTIVQALRDLPPGPVQAGTRDAVLELARAAEAPQDVEARRKLRGEVRAAIAGVALDDLEGQGQLAARAVRDALARNGEPIEDVKALLGSCGVGVSAKHRPGDGARMVVEARTEGSAWVHVLDTPRTKVSWARRFECARALGHVLLDPAPEGATGAASSDYSERVRRRRSGAFAAELLVPISAFDGVVPRGATWSQIEPKFQGLLDRYQVGARTLAHQLWNHGYLSSPETRDDLIEVFGSGPT